MTDELLATLVRANLAASIAILVVIALRIPARRLFGARVTYGLWLLAPLAFAANLIPHRAATVADPDIARHTQMIEALPDTALMVWLLGAAASVVLLAFGQWRFLRAERAGRAGPAVVGIIAPRFVTPADYEARYAPEERRLIRAHERAHMDRYDPRVNALIALAQCVNWFNPLVHLAATLARMDQELACDATVMARHPQSRRAYASAMLKTGLSVTPLPLGCRWLAHPLETRVAMLKASHSPGRFGAGLIVITALSLAAGYGAWFAQPLQPPRQTWQPERQQVLRITPSTATVVLPDWP